jgi:hypothetical protein
MPKKNIPIDYSARDFQTIKNALVEHAKKYYPETYKDFSEVGFGSLMLDTVAYIGDNLSFYLDYTANETFLDTASEFDNILKLSKPFGFKYSENPSSHGIATFYILVAANDFATAPDERYIPILKKNSTFTNRTGTAFSLVEDVFFNREDNEVVVGSVNENTGLPETYAIKAYGKVQSGYLTQTFYEVADFQRFLKIPVNIDFLTDIISVTDGEGNEYYEVDYLSQDIVYRSIINRDNNDENSEVKSILKPFSVPRRFVVIRERDRTYLQFGTGDASSETYNSELVDPATVTIDVYGKNYITDKEFDPNNLIKTDKLGVVPSNTTLRIVARANTSNNVNTGAGTIVSVGSALFDFGDTRNLNTTFINNVRSSLEVNNEEPIVGDTPGVTPEELKFRVYNTFGSQNRAVTEKDYEALMYNMPPEFGSVKRVSIVRDYNSFKRNINIYVVSSDSVGKLTNSNAVLKENVKVWLNKNKMINDTVDILDAKIVNLSIKFSIVADMEADNAEVLRNCISALETEYSKTKFIGEAFFISDIYSILKNVQGVNDVKNVKVEQKNGVDYSDVFFDINRFMSRDGRYIEAPKNIIFEIKFPRSDIYGEVS